MGGDEVVLARRRSVMHARQPLNIRCLGVDDLSVEINMISKVLVRALVVAAKEQGIVRDEAEFRAWLELDLADPADAISRATFVEVLEAVAARASDGSAAARLGARVGAGQLHFFGLLWMSSVTLQQAIQRLLVARRTLLGGPAWRLVESGPLTLLGYPSSSLGAGTRLEAQFLTALAFRLVMDLLGPCASDALRVQFAFAEPGDSHTLRDALPCPVSFGASLNAVAIPTELITRRRPGSDEVLSLEMEKFVHERFLSGGAPSWASRVRQMLLVADRPGCVELEALAVSWGVSARSVRRRLGEEGVRYQDLREDVCMALAGDWLQRRRDHPSEIARMLGREVTSFRRAFKRHFGTTPTGYRRGEPSSSPASQAKEEP